MFENLRTHDRERRTRRFEPLRAQEHRRVMYYEGGYYAVLPPILWRRPGSVLRWSNEHQTWFLQALVK